jgi:hypothetical protein
MLQMKGGGNPVFLPPIPVNFCLFPLARFLPEFLRSGFDKDDGPFKN